MCFLAWGTINGQEKSSLLEGLHAIPKPDVSGMSPSIQDIIHNMQRTVEDLLETPDVDITELATKFGELGQFYHAYHYDDAGIDVYENALILDPTQTRWSYLLAFLYLEKGRVEDAAKRFQDVLDGEPDDLYATVRLANVMLDLDKPDQAGALFQKAYEIKPDEAIVLFGLGKVAAAQRRFEEAVTYYEKALALQGEATVIHYPLAMAYRSLRNREKATYYLERRGEGKINFPDPRLREVRQIITLSTVNVVLDMAASPDEVDPRNMLGFTLTKLGDRPQMVDYFQVVFDQKQKENPPASKVELARIKYIVGGMLAYDGKLEESVPHLVKATQLWPEFVDAHVYLGKVYGRLKDFDRALACFDKALSADPTVQEGLLARASILVNLGKLPEARTDLENLLRQYPDDQKARLRYISVLEMLGSFDKAIEQVNRLLEMDQPDMEKAYCYYRLAKLFINQGDTQKALEHFRTSLNINPKVNEVRIDYAASLAKNDQMELAIPEYRKIIQADPSNRDVRLGEIACLILTEKYAQSMVRLQEAVTAFPDDVPFTLILARLYAACPQTDQRDGARALTLVQSACGDRARFLCLETRAMALAQQGHYDEAKEIQADILAHAPEDHPVTQRIRENLKRYQDDQPCCQTYTPETLLPRFGPQ